ncbi:WXG100 family type VII secretion target [Nocardia thailandica]
MGEFLADSAAISAASRSLTSINSSLESGLRSVAADIEQLLSDGWAGEAADAFKSAFDEYRTSFDQLMTDASTIMSAVPKAVDTLVRTDTANAGDLRTVQSSLDL